MMWKLSMADILRDFFQEGHWWV